MGGFAGVLGHAAAGFEQAQQQDLQRQFVDEQNRRAAAGEFLRGIAADPNQSDELRQLTGQQYLQLLQNPGKKLNFKQVFEPVFNHISQVSAQQKAYQQQLQNLPPFQRQQMPGANMPPSPPASVLNQGVTATPTIGAQPPAGGAAGPPQQVAGPPQLNFQATPPPSAIFQGAGARTIQTPTQVPPPPPGVFAGIPQIAEHEATMASAQSGGALTGQMQARSAMADRIMQDPQYAGMIQNDPMMQQMLMSMKMGVQLPVSYYGMMNRSAGKGESLPGSDLIAQGITKTEDGISIDPSKFYNENKRLGLPSTFTPTAGKGQTAATGGGLQSQTQQQEQTANVHYGVWQKENRTQFGQRQALLNQAFQLGVERNAYGDANRALVDTVKDYGNAAKTMDSMDEAYKTVQQNPNNQQAQVALLMSHIGMTLGVVKGARVGKAQIEDAENSRNMFAGAASKLNFDKDGNLDWSDPIRKGVTLTPDQMKQMVELGHQRMNILHQNIGRMHDELDPNTMGTQYITPTPMGGGGTRKAAGGGPPKQPTAKGAGAPIPNDPLGIR